MKELCAIWGDGGVMCKNLYFWPSSAQKGSILYGN
jgi:hypothetical protein